MPSPLSAFEAALTLQHNGADHCQQLDVVVVDVIRQVEADMQRPPAHTVYELITTSLRGRVPGVQFNARWSVTPQPGSSSKLVRCSDNGSIDLYLQERGPERRR